MSPRSPEAQELWAIVNMVLLATLLGGLLGLLGDQLDRWRLRSICHPYPVDMNTGDCKEPTP